VSFASVIEGSIQCNAANGRDLSAQDRMEKSVACADWIRKCTGALERHASAEDSLGQSARSVLELFSPVLKLGRF
jgi:hypothetical protein